MSTSPIDRLLAKARLQPRAYTREQMAAAEDRLAARVANRLVHGALSLDDYMEPARAQIALPKAPQQRSDGWQPDEKLVEDAAGALRAVCRALVGDEGALHHLSSFIGRIPEPEGAAVLGCVLQLAGREDSARFWWQYAAGAGHIIAAYCLYLHHLALGEAMEADWWHAQMVPDRHLWGLAEHGVTMHYMELGMEGKEPTATVRVTMLPEAAEAVVRYVPTAIEYLDDVDLPMPTDGFAERIEQLAATR
ncbi:hypothetical protein [Streptomyces sp. SAJ15]|uniref:hypothetical protein n=1 Tax=Streptomyces sp. SAJ15 TaxID=2011095 RepID=UPI0011864F83|nr:hypothetical protein [Streptomyces sp. SAJ15]TVL88493.1 hypothetical protein CD790_31130 [Streptomyces sp. SAJ15]